MKTVEPFSVNSTPFLICKLCQTCASSLRARMSTVQNTCIRKKGYSRDISRLFFSEKIFIYLPITPTLRSRRLMAWGQLNITKKIGRNYKKYSLINTLCFLQSICDLCLIYRELKVMFSGRKASISNLVKSYEGRCDVKRATNLYERLFFCFRNDLVKGVVFGMFVEFTPLQLNHRISQIRHLK